jgi:hypothetical protein
MVSTRTKRYKKAIHTSWSKKLIKPVATMGLPIQIYQATHCFSIHEREEKSVPAYRLSMTFVVALNDIVEERRRRDGGQAKKRAMAADKWVFI